MRVGVFLGNSLPEAGGGFTLEREVFRALIKLIGESPDTFVVFSRDENLDTGNLEFVSIKKSYVAKGISLLYRVAAGAVGKVRHPSRPFRIRGAYDKIVACADVDVVWCLVPYCLTMEIPYLFTVWDLQHQLQPYFPEVSTKDEWNVRERNYAVPLRRAAVILTGTQTGKDQIERFYQIPAERIKVLPLPVPKLQDTVRQANQDAGPVLKQYDIPKGYLLYPAQFWPHKNHAGLFRAIQWLRKEYQMVLPVVLVGSDQGNLKYIQRLANELDLSSQVYFLGFVLRTDLLLLYQNAFALIFPTFFGPDNLPPLEAFASGCPVIASNVAGADEQLGDAALLFDPKSPKQMALAIKSLYDNPELRQTLIHRGFERAAKWSGQDYVRGVFAILREFEPIRQCWD